MAIDVLQYIIHIVVPILLLKLISDFIEALKGEKISHVQTILIWKRNLTYEIIFESRIIESIFDINDEMISQSVMNHKEKERKMAFYSFEFPPY